MTSSFRARPITERFRLWDDANNCILSYFFFCLFFLCQKKVFSLLPSTFESSACLSVVSSVHLSYLTAWSLIRAQLDLNKNAETWREVCLAGLVGVFILMFFVFVSFRLITFFSFCRLSACLGLLACGCGKSPHAEFLSLFLCLVLFRLQSMGWMLKKKFSPSYVIFSCGCQQNRIQTGLTLSFYSEVIIDSIN